MESKGITTIRLSKEFWGKLKSMKKGGETFEELLKRLLDI